MDTETLIALVSSLLDTPLNQDVILDALINNNGDVEATAKDLSRSSVADVSDASSSTRPSSGNKRKRTGDLNSWLKPPSSKSSKTSLQVPTLPVSPVQEKPKPTASHPPSPVKPVANLMDVLRQPPSPKKSGPARLPPLTLTNPVMVAQHTPCTLHYSILPPELACSLFYTMCRESLNWKRNKWWLFERVVESPHLTSFYARQVSTQHSEDDWRKAARHWYNGRQTDSPRRFPDDLEAACLHVEKVVQAEMQKRKRMPLEYAGHSTTDIWKANVAASNRYLGGEESVGFHSDQLTGIGPYATIASISLGVRRNFSLREVIPKSEKDARSARTFNVPLPHNSLIIMHGSCQEKFKHSIPPQSTIDLFHPLSPSPPDLNASDCSRTRINITFRFYRPDFHPDTIPKCKCDVPTVLRPDMKNRSDGKEDKYWWSCYAGAQNEGKGCDFWEVMEFDKEGRGPAIRQVTAAVVDEEAPVS